jgi:SAM-dependent methyltransferase
MSMSADVRCRSCGAEGLRRFLSLGEMPLTDAYVQPERADEPEPRFPLDVAFCSNCFLVQILHAVPPVEIFLEYSYYSSVSRMLLEHSRVHAQELVSDRGLGTDSLVVEVASNDGYLLQNFVKAGIPVLGIDPALGPARSAEAIGIPTLQEFFTSDLATRLRSEGKQADVLLANNVLAHVPDPNDFVAGISTILHDNGIAEIEAPYMKDLIDNLEFDTIYHEHLSYFSVTAAKSLFERHGLSLNHLRHFPIHGGTFRFTLGRKPAVSDAVRALLIEDRAAGLTGFDYFRDFGHRVTRLQGQLRGFLQELKAAGKRIAAYGAAAKGTILLNSSGIGSDVIDFVADRSPHKQGHLMPGVRIPISPPERVLDEMPDYVLLLAWNIKDEIIRQESAYLENGGRFIVPIPRPVVFGRESIRETSNGAQFSTT